ncbi:MAG: L-aspartate oxidase [Phycisphaerae bacterium]
MSTLYDTRRYLTNFDSARTGHIFADVLVIGGGVAGARAAIEAARHVDNVLLVCKEAMEESATRYAQGGVANARAEGDSSAKHVADTLRVGCGLNRPEAVELVIRQAPDRIDELIQWGMRFDKDGDRLAMTREGGHSMARVLHADGDATGRELARVLTARVRQCDNIRVFEQCFVIDLITDQGRCLGAVTHHNKHGHQLVWGEQTILASGGGGRVYRETTNPPVATGDGLAIAYRAGARMADLEMVQFHPTTLYVAGANRVLISEAVRGEGALLVDGDGQRFMESYHPDAELAPRDVVCRAIFKQMRLTRSNCVYLDVSPIGAERFVGRFPGITRFCSQFQIDVRRDLIPVRPAAHYMIGGVVADLDASTNIDGLLCCGEASCSGLHGANRLASNSLLEGLVFGAIAGESAGTRVGRGPGRLPPVRIQSEVEASPRTELDLQDIRNSLRSVTWRNAGIERTGQRLSEMCEIIDFWGHYVLDKTFDDSLGWETQNMLSLCRLIATAAFQRTRSLGVHFRTDEGESAIVNRQSSIVNQPDDAQPSHILIQRGLESPTISRAGLDLRTMNDEYHKPG